MPITSPITVAVEPTNSESREPTRTRLKTSRPRLSVPIQAGSVFQVEPDRFGKGIGQVDGDGVIGGHCRAEDGHECEAEQKDAADDSQGQAERDAQHPRGRPQPQTIGQPFKDHQRRGHAVTERVAKVQLQRALPENEVLDDGVLVQPHLAADLLVLGIDLLTGPVRVQVDTEAGRIARYPDQEKDQRHNQKYDEHRLQQAANDKGAHGILSAACDDSLHGKRLLL